MRDEPKYVQKAPVLKFEKKASILITKELVIREIKIDGAAGRGDSDSRMTSFKVIINPNQLQKPYIEMHCLLVICEN